MQKTHITLMYITNNPDVALVAEKNAVQRIWIDLETLGKQERQHNINSVKSHHCVSDIEIISKLLTNSELLVRVNPMNPCSEHEINQVIEAGADMIMLPMWKTVDEVQTFIRFVNGRVKTTLLLETKEAVECINQILEKGGFDEIHIGLNDLHFSYGLDFMFELLVNGTVEELCHKFKVAGIPYGFGGIARIGAGMLPAEKIIMEHYRLGSTRAILSRSFCNTEEISDIKEIENIFETNMKTFILFEASLTEKTDEDFKKNYLEIKKLVSEIVEDMRRKKA